MTPIKANAATAASVGHASRAFSRSRERSERQSQAAATMARSPARAPRRKAGLLRRPPTRRRHRTGRGPEGGGEQERPEAEERGRGPADERQEEKEDGGASEDYGADRERGRIAVVFDIDDENFGWPLAGEPLPGAEHRDGTERVSARASTLQRHGAAPSRPQVVLPREMSHHVGPQAAHACLAGGRASGAARSSGPGRRARGPRRSPSPRHRRLERSGRPPG